MSYLDEVRLRRTLGNLNELFWHEEGCTSRLRVM